MKRRKIKERFAALAAAAAVLMCAAGCGNNGGKDPAQTTASSSSQEETKAPVKVTLPPVTTTSGTGEETPLLGEDLPYKPAMWKATSPDGTEMYMMGSMHALNDTCYPLPDYITEAYEQSDVLAVECDITEMLSGYSVQLRYASKMTYPEGESITDHLSENTWENLTDYFGYYDIDPEKYENTAAWVIYSSIQTYSLKDTGLTADKGIDRYLIEKAKEDSKEVYEIESVDSQLKMLMDFPDELYDHLLSSYNSQTAPLLRDQNIELFEAWKTGDVEWIEANAETELESADKEHKAMMEDFYKAMHYDRNAHMASDAEELVKSGKKPFIVVGLAHYLGDKGIIALLEKDGYKVERTA